MTANFWKQDAPAANFVIEVWEPVPSRPKRGHWKPVLNPHGTRPAFSFESLGKARRFAKKHMIGLFPPAQVRNIITGETWSVS